MIVKHKLTIPTCRGPLMNEGEEDQDDGLEELPGGRHLAAPGVNTGLEGREVSVYQGGLSWT